MKGFGVIIRVAYNEGFQGYYKDSCKGYYNTAITFMTKAFTKGYQKGCCKADCMRLRLLYVVYNGISDSFGFRASGLQEFRL